MNSNLLGIVFTLVVLTATTVSGHASIQIETKGSDTLANVAQQWIRAYKEINPDVVISVSGSNSGAGIASFINGAVDIANSSRVMRRGEVTVHPATVRVRVDRPISVDSFDEQSVTDLARRVREVVERNYESDRASTRVRS